MTTRRIKLGSVAGLRVRNDVFYLKIILENANGVGVICCPSAVGGRGKGNEMLRVRCESLARMGHALDKLYTNLLLAEQRDLAQAEYELSKMHKMIRQHCLHNGRPVAFSEPHGPFPIDIGRDLPG